MPDERETSDLALDVVSEAARDPAVDADWIEGDRGAEQVRQLAATAASVMVTPSSTVWKMASASRLAVAFKAGPGVFDARCENLHLHAPQDPFICASPRQPRARYTLRIREGPGNVACRDTRPVLTPLIHGPV
jgi:hypothetical protein